MTDRKMSVPPFNMYIQTLSKEAAIMPPWYWDLRV